MKTTKLRSILAGTAIAALALFAGTATPLGVSVATQAEAAVNVSLSVFYDELEPHGDWVRYRDAYVFIPAISDRNWRPYTRGRWAHTERYGWMWVSDEPFGWATYHYGRWGYAEDIGWYWVPGRRWAPAWVSWRRGSDHIVWAPLPPSRGDGVDVDVSISISVGEIPEFYWVAVPARRFLAPDIGVVVLDDEPEIRDVIARTEFIGVPRVTNNIVVNNVIDVDVVVEATGEQVEAVEVRTVDDPREAQASGDELAVFQAEVEAEPDAKPQEVREVSEVEKVTRPDADAGEGEAAGTEPAEPDAAAAPEGEEEQPAAGATPEEAPAETAAEPESGEPAQQQAEDEDQPGEQPAQLQAEEQPGQGQPEDVPAQQQAEEQPGQGQPEDVPARQQAEEQPEEAQPGEQPAPRQAEEQPGRGQPEDVPAQQRAEEQPEQPADEATGTTAPPEPPAAREEDARGQRGEGRGQGRECDPATDPDCEPAQ